MDLDAPSYLRLIAYQLSQPRLERVGQGFRESRQQYPRLRVAARQGDCAMQRDDGLAGPGRPGDSSRPGVAAFDELPLRRMQKDRPFFPWELERAFQLLDVDQHPETALRVGMAERIGGC